MRSVRFIAVFFVCLGSLHVCGSELRFTINLRSPAEPMKSGEEVRLRASIVNVSNHDIKFARPLGLQDEEVDYAIEIRDSHGQQPAMTPFFRKLKEVKYGFQSYMTYVLEPGKSFDDDLVITRLYMLTAPAEYTVTVARGVRPAWQLLGQGGAKDIVKSNTITLRLAK
jgi:hypothetical protein